MPEARATPYWRLSGFYLFYFATLGALLPYWALYLQDLGHDALAIGQLMALLMASKIVAPNIWAWLADRSGRRMPLVRWAAAGTLACFCGVFAGNSFAWLAVVVLAFGFFFNAALPQFEATTLNHLGREAHRYSHVRVWGSIGFIVSVLSLGMLFDVAGRALLPFGMALLLAATWLVSCTVPEAGAAAVAVAPPPTRAVLGRREVVALLLASLLMQASHGPYYSFFSIHLDAAGYAANTIGGLWALGVIAEVFVFLFAHRLLVRFGARQLLVTSLALTVLRWLAIGWLVDSLAWLVCAQLLHAASFGSYHAAAMHMVHRLFPASHQGRGQALYSSLSFGAGGALGSLLGGYAWSAFGAAPTWFAAALVALLGLAVCSYGLRPPPVSEPEKRS
jgi:PPP family 3-phenylpropionic acid transporter